jgi:hypothetical protein
MEEAVRRGRPVSIGTRVAAVLAAPLAPLFGLLVAYLARALSTRLGRGVSAQDR